MRIFVLFISMMFSINWDYNDKPSNPGGDSNKGKQNQGGDKGPGGSNNNGGPGEGKKVKIQTGEMKEFMEYCQAKYNFFKKRENYKLERLVVVFRHGDRAPLRDISDEWRKKNCVECPLVGQNINSCSLKRCESGELSVKGSKQAKDLGNFIKVNYKPLLFEKDIVEEDIGYRATSIRRTYSTLFNVMSGIAKFESIKNVDIRKSNDGLLRPKNCMFLESQISRDAEVDESLKRKLRSLGLSDPKKISDKSDEIRCSMCNDIPVSCGGYDCNSDTLSEIAKLSHSTWIKQMKNVSTCDRGKKIIFGRFAKDLLDILDSDKSLYLISAHDGTLSMILSAISSETYPWPPYASALFLEVWCKYGRQFVRMIYNNKVVEFDEYSGEYIPINKFTTFLERMKLEEGELEGACKSEGAPNNIKVSNLTTSHTQNKLLMDLPLFI